MSARRRLDVELVRREIAPSRAQAQVMIQSGNVRVAGAPTTNAARLVAAHEPIVVVDPPRFVSRGGEKLDAAVERFGVSVDGRRALDVGASTGGFTDCMLQRGARHVVALDVGHSQLHERIRRDARVDVRERTNVRNVTLADFDDRPFDLITADVSFISLRVIAAVIARDLAAPGADLLVLIKPQFEAGRAEVSRGKGVVGGVELWRRVLEDVISAMNDVGAATMGVMVSPLLGAEGNVEFLAHLRAHAVTNGENMPDVALDTVLADAAAHGGGA